MQLQIEQNYLQLVSQPLIQISMYNRRQNDYSLAFLLTLSGFHASVKELFI